MGFLPVLLHLPTIFRALSFCKRDILLWQPDVVILVDYPGFNLKIAKFLHREREKWLKALGRRGWAAPQMSEGVGVRPQVFYYISPKIWAWKEWRIRNIKRDVDQLYSILPFEVEFFERKHHYPIHYVGNPTAHEVRQFRQNYHETFEEFVTRQNTLSTLPVIALLAGSRKQEIKDNLPAMIEAAIPYTADYQLVVAGAPSVEDDYYAPFIDGKPVTLVHNETFALLSHATVALVTSGTATLETALFDVPQVVCYKTRVPRLMRFAFNHIIKCRFISLVNLIADREVVRELLADRFSVDNIRDELRRLLPGHDARTAMLFDYREVRKRLGEGVAPDNTARLMVDRLKK